MKNKAKTRVSGLKGKDQRHRLVPPTTGAPLSVIIHLERKEMNSKCLKKILLLIFSYLTDITLHYLLRFGH